MNTEKRPVGRPPGRTALPLPPIREKLYAAQLKAQETKNRVSEGALVDAAKAEAQWLGMIATSRTRLLQIPARIAAQHPGHRDIIETLERELLTALAELAEDEL